MTLTSGRTNPGCGDLDGDGRGEIVIGFGLRMRGVVQIFDDTQTGFSALTSAQTNVDGYMQMPVPDGFWGSIYPAIGDIDGDGMDEIVAGLGRTTGSVDSNCPSSTSEGAMRCTSSPSPSMRK